MSPRQSLVQAAQRGHYVQLDVLLHLGVDVNSVALRTTALAEAARNGHTHCVKLLLEAGANVNLPSAWDTPLMLALVRPNNQYCVNLLMAAEKDNVQNHVRQRDRTTLMSAAIGGYSEAALKILSGVENVQKTLAMCDDSRNTALTYAAMNGRVDFIRRVIVPRYHFSNQITNAVAIEKHVLLCHTLMCYDDVEAAVNQCDKNELTPLALSVALDNVECTKILLDNRACLDAVDSNGRHALIYAAACGSLRCLKMLIAAGSTLEWVDRQFQSALTVVCRNGHSECLHVLLNAWREGGGMERNNNDSVPNCLAMVTLRRSYRAIKILRRRRGADRFRITSRDRETAADWSLPRSLSNELDESDDGGMTPLDYACKNGHVRCVLHLLRAGVDPNKCNTRGMFPLMMAACEGHMNVAHELYRANVNINAVDTKGNTALFYAASGNNIDFIEFLLQHGASSTLENNIGSTAISQAAACGYLPALQCLLMRNSRSTRKYLRDSGRDLIVCAAENGQNQCIIMLLNLGVNFRSHISDGCKAAFQAVRGGHLDTLKLLIDGLGVPVHPIHSQERSLFTVACSSQAPMPLFEFLIERGAQFDRVQARTFLSPLMITCQNGNQEMTKRLLRLGARTFYRDCFGFTPLIHAVKGLSPACARIILADEKRRRVRLFDISHRKALMCAVSLHNSQCISVFLEEGVFIWTWYSFCLANTHHDSRILLSNMVSHSISPEIFRIKRTRYSALKYALKHLAFGTVKFLLANLYITSYDYTNLCHYARQQELLTMDIEDDDKAVVRTLFANPWPLSTLSFLAISSAINDNTDRFQRVQAVEKLPIPDCLKRKLAFTTQTAKICISQWPKLLKEPHCPIGPDSILKVSNDTTMWSNCLTRCSLSDCPCQGTGFVLAQSS